MSDGHEKPQHPPMDELEPGEGWMWVTPKVGSDGYWAKCKVAFTLKDGKIVEASLVPPFGPWDGGPIAVREPVKDGEEVEDGRRRDTD